MALQSEGPISLQQIGQEFGKTPPYTMSEVRGVNSTVTIPSIGPLSFSDFYGAENVDEWIMQSSAIHDFYDYSGSPSSITLNWNQPTLSATSSHSSQPYANDFNDWQAGDLLIVTTKLTNYEVVGGSTIYLKSMRFMGSPSGWTRTGYTSTYAYDQHGVPSTAIFAKVLTNSDVTGNGSYTFPIGGDQLAYDYRLGFCWWRLRQTASSGHSAVFAHSSTNRTDNQAFNTYYLSSPDPPPTTTDSSTYTTGSTAILVGIGHRLGDSWVEAVDNDTHSELSDLSSNSFSHDGGSNNRLENFFSSIQTWDAATVPDSNARPRMDIDSASWAWLYTNP